MEKKYDVVTNQRGSVVPDVAITVYIHDGTLQPTVKATIYSDNSSTTRSNPVITDALGYFEFYAADGHYDIKIVGPGIIDKWVYDILLEDPADSPSPTFAALAAPGGAGLVGFIQSGAGAVARTAQDKAREQVSLEDFFLAAEADSTGMVQRAIAVLPITGGVISCTGSAYIISGLIEIGNGTTASPSTRNGIVFRGRGMGASSSDSSSHGAATRFIWNGAAGGTMFRINGPIAACQFTDVCLDGNGIAANPLQAIHIFSSVLRNVLICNFTGIGLQAKSRDAAIAGMVRGCDDNIFDTVKVIAPAATGAVAADFGSDAPTGANVVGMSRNTFTNCFFVGGATGSGTVLRYFDNNIFIGTTSTTLASPSTAGNALNIVPPPLAMTFPHEVVFVGCPIIGTRSIVGTWSELGAAANGITFYPQAFSDDAVNTVTHPNFWGNFRTRTRMRQSMARLALSASQNLPTGVETAIAWDAESYDTDFVHDNVTNKTRLTAPVAGGYSFDAHVQFSAGSVGSRYLLLKVNGTTSYALKQRLPESGGDTWHDTSDTLYLNAGDYVEVYAYQSSGGVVTAVSGLGTYCTCIYIGA